VLSGAAPRTTIHNIVRRLRPSVSGSAAAILTVADQIIVSGSNVFIGILLARWLARPDFGIYALLFSTFTLLLGLHNALLIEPLSVFGGGMFRRSLAVYKQHCVSLHVLLIVILIPICILLGSVLSAPGDSVVAFSLCLLGAASFSLLYLLLRRIAYTGGMRGRALAAGIVNLATTLSALVIARRVGTLTWATGLFAQAIGGLAAASLLWFLIGRSNLREQNGRVGFNSVLKQHWDYGRWSLGTALVFWLSADAYSVMVGRFLGPESAAAFRTALNLTMFIPNFLAAIAVLILPQASGFFYDRKHSEFRRLILSFAALSLVTALVGGIILWLDGAQVLGLVYGKQYRATASILQPLILNMVLLSGSQAFQTQIRAANKPRRIFEAFLAAAICTCTIGLTLTWGYRLQGAALGLCCSTLCFVVVLWAPWRLTSDDQAYQAHRQPGESRPLRFLSRWRDLPPRESASRHTAPQTWSGQSQL
jgi:O-antigen/teichoic acid export membrane protein